MVKANIWSTRLRKLELVAVIVLLLFLPLVLLKPSITGFVSSDAQRQQINMTLDESKLIQMHTKSGQSASLNYLAISGEIIGDGDVAVYLRNSAGDKLMVYGNVGKPNRPNLITGLAVAANPANAEFDDEMILSTGNKLAWPGDLGFNTGGGSFGRTCLETCFLDAVSWTGNSWDIVAYVEPGTQLKITELSYTLST